MTRGPSNEVVASAAGGVEASSPVERRSMLRRRRGECRVDGFGIAGVWLAAAHSRPLCGAYRSRQRTSLFRTGRSWRTRHRHTDNLFGWPNLVTQYADLALDLAFTKVSTGGPYAGNTDAVSFTELEPGMQYYARIRTIVGSQILTSDALIVVASCPAPATITKPTGLLATPVGPQTIAVRWRPARATAGTASTRLGLSPIS